MLSETDYKTLYPLVKGFVIQYECGGNPDKLDMDVFHETCFKVLRLMRGKEEWMGISFESIEKYVCKSYRINCKREKMYYRNSKECAFENFDGFEVADQETKDTDILERIGLDVSLKFSPELRQLFARHVYNNISINELEKESGIKNLKYKFKKIRDYLRHHQDVRELREGMK